MSKKIIIADASVLIALSNIDELEFLRKIYTLIIITPQVEEEFGCELPEWIQVQKVLNTNLIMVLKIDLDEGEASSIALALERKNSLLIIDERKGRGIARSMGVSIIGLLGVFIKAKETGIIEEIKPIIEKLESAKFRISKELKNMILERVGEK